MSVKALQDYTFVSKYAQYLKPLKRRETWNESIDRVRDMNLRRYPQIKEEMEWAFEISRKKKVLGSQRALQFGGKAIEKNNARIYNCAASYCDRLRFFQESFWMLLAGTGVGFSVQKHHIAKLPTLINEKKNQEKTFIIQDSIEGWADSLGALISSYINDGEFKDFKGCDVVFDYTSIRPEGSPLSSSSGKAPGPEPLRKGLEKVRSILQKCFEDNQEKLKPINAYDIVMHISDAVLSGGVRRSATICLFSPDDLEMASAKTGNWFVDNPQRGRSNNSALLLKNKTTKEEFLNLMKYVKEFGEPGFIWSDSTELVTNPCCEISLYPVDIETGLTGFEVCNLCEINGKKCNTIEDFKIACRAAAIIGTCQAGYTDMGYLGETSKKIIEREALLGVSITGMMDNPDIIFDKKIQIEMAEYILEVNAEIASKIGINPCARATCCKPAGTTSCLLGTSSGIHPHHAKRYIRRSQGNRLEAPLQYFKKINPLAVEKSVWSANGTDEIVSFCIEVPKGAKVKNDLSALELLNYVKLTQENWVTYGTRKERCVQPWLVHNVSNTITVKDEEWEDVSNYIYDNRQSFCGISLLPISGDKDYPQAPFTAIYTPIEIAKMYGDGSLMASGLIVDALHAFDDNLWKACDAVLDNGIVCIKENDASFADNIKTDWIRRANQFAERYFGKDIRLMTYCLKDVANWKYWCDLNREYKDVDFTTMVEETDGTKLEQTIACSGGSCSLGYV